MIKYSISIFTFILIVFFCKAQPENKMKHTVNRLRLSAKEMKNEIKNKKGVLDSIFSNKYLKNTYLLDDGRTIVSFGSHGYLYNSFHDLEEWLKELEIGHQEKEISHILANKLLYGKEFPKHVLSLSDTLKEICQLGEIQPSLESLKKVDLFIIKNFEKIKLNDQLFSSLVAYVGMIMKNEMMGADWEMINLQSDNKIWEPYVLFKDKRYNPFFPVYRELYEELPETGKISIYDRVRMELGR